MARILNIFIFVFLLAICMSSFEKYLFTSFAHFKIRLFRFHAIYWVPATSQRLTPYQINSLQLLPPAFLLSAGCSFIVRILYSLMWFLLPVSTFEAYVSESTSKEFFPRPVSWNLPPIFHCFRVPAHTFAYLAPLQLTPFRCLVWFEWQWAPRGS